MGLLNRKNSKIDAIGKDAPPAAFEKAHICVNGPAITLELKSVKTESHYGDYVYGSGLGERRKITVPATRFKGSLDEAREYAAALNTAIIDASRLEGAVASIYPKN